MYAKIQAVINPDKQIQFAALPNYYPAMLLEVMYRGIMHVFDARISTNNPKRYLKSSMLFVFQMVKMCLIHNPRERASVADLLSFPFEMVIEIEK